MKTIRALALLTFLLLATPNLCLAMMDIAVLSRAEAKKMGMEVRSMPAGPNAVRVELEFETKGELKSFHRVDLDFGEGDRFLVTSSLREERPKPGRVMVGFAADRAQLGKLTLRIVAGDPGNLSGYDLRVKDFVDLGKLK
jgi:hypothetical protein